MNAIRALTLLLCLASVPLAAQEPVLRVYGPGGPAPAMKEAAAAFGAARGLRVEVTAGPTPEWADRAKQDADVVFSGAENMMSGFTTALPGLFELRDAEPLYLRPAAILVRPGNPKAIRGLRDLVKPGIKVLTVGGAGQVGLWEDVAGRTGDIRLVRELRRNLVFPEPGNSAEAKKQWTEQRDIDAWLIWNIWQVANPDVAQVVALEQEFRIYRDAGVVVTQRGKQSSAAQSFVDFLKSADGRRIFAKWGWVAGRP